MHMLTDPSLMGIVSNTYLFMLQPYLVISVTLNGRDPVLSDLSPVMWRGGFSGCQQGSGLLFQCYLLMCIFVVCLEWW